jgi:hypothetical protein
MRLPITINGVKATDARLGRINAALSEGGAVRRTLEIAARKIESYIADRFRAQSDPHDMRWLPLKESTIEQRERNLLLGRTRGASRGWAVMTRGERQTTSRQQRLKKWGSRGGKIKKGAHTRLEKMYARGGIKILEDSGQLRQSIHVRAIGLSLWIMSDRHYLIYHQTGTKNMVQREILPLDPVDPTGRAWSLPIDGSGGALWAGIRNDIKRALI